MADDDGGGGPLGDSGKKIAGVPQPVAIGGIVLLGAAGLAWWLAHRKKSGASSSATTVITGSGSTGISNGMLDAMLKDWQQHPATTSSSTAASGTGTGSGGGSGGASGPTSATATGSGTATGTATTTPPTSPNSSTTTNEAGQMHGITLAQAQYLFDTGNQPYVYNSATNSYVRWNGLPVSGQTFYAGPLNWQDALKDGQVIGGTKGHPVLKAAATAAKTTAKKATTPAKKT
jgi:hypothetical protein